MIMKILNAKTEPGHTNFPDCLQFGLRQSSGLAFKSDLFGALPGYGSLDTRRQGFEMAHTDVSRRAAAKIDKFQRTVCNRGKRTVDFYLFCQYIKIFLNLVAVFIRINPEVTK